jgi:hypothetical protein
MTTSLSNLEPLGVYVITTDRIYAIVPRRRLPHSVSKKNFLRTWFATTDIHYSTHA